MHLACILFKMSMNEALVAATINAAASLGRAHLQGSIEVGKMADLVLLDADRWTSDVTIVYFDADYI